MLLSLPTLCRADDPRPQDITILDYLWAGFHKLPDLKEGILIDYRHQRALNTVGIAILNGSSLGSFWGNFSLDGNYIGQDGIGGSITMSLRALPVEDVPILKYLEYGYVGYGGGWRTLAFNPSTDNAQSDNQAIHGPVIAARFNF